MRILQIATVSLTTAIFSPQPALAASEERMDVAQALGIMADDACRQAFGDDEEAVQACIDDDVFGVEGRNSAQFMEEDDEEVGEDKKRCVELGGVISARMPECSNAMGAVQLAEARDEQGNYFRALGDVVDYCSAKWLCMP